MRYESAIVAFNTAILLAILWYVFAERLTYIDHLILN